MRLSQFRPISRETADLLLPMVSAIKVSDFPLDSNTSMVVSLLSGDMAHITTFWTEDEYRAYFHSAEESGIFPPLFAEKILMSSSPKVAFIG